jgi:two-component system cell cycle response regulator
MPDGTSHARQPILVVDDAPQNLKLLRVILKDAGYPVSEAASGEEALAKLHAEVPAAMILDVRMPGMTGYDVCRAVRHDPQFAHLPVIMLTALSQPEERIRGIEAGATDFISKPFNKKELLARVETSLALSAANGALITQLPGAVVIADPDWRVLGFSPDASLLLGVPAAGLAGQDFLLLLERRGVMLPSELSARVPRPSTFRANATSTDHGVIGHCTPVFDAEGRIALWVAVLAEPST